MIVWRFKEEPETRGAGFPNKAFRWVVETEGLGIFLAHQCQDRSTGEWSSSHAALYGIWLSTRFAFGSYHFYYDGPHCIFSIGFLHFQWLNVDCERCSIE